MLHFNPKFSKFDFRFLHNQKCFGRLTILQNVQKLFWMSKIGRLKKCLDVQNIFGRAEIESQIWKI